MAKTVLISLGDPAESRRIADALSRPGIESRVCEDIERAIRGQSGPPADLIILDLGVLPAGDVSSASFIKTVGCPVIALADPDSPGEAEDALEAGALDVIVKPAMEERIESAVRSALKISALEHEIARIRRETGNEPGLADLVAVSPEMQRAVELARRAAALDLPVMIEGEPGTGRKLFARSIRAASPRSNAPYVMMRRSQPSRSAFEAPASDACAIARRWAEARGGILFIEEIGELTAAGQAELAALIEAQSLASMACENSVRLFCGSSKNLIEKVKKGQFREDLYYRINVFPIWLPPLRDRPDDIAPLARRFLRQVIAEQGKSIEDIDPDALKLLRAYVWPGNVRQLENAVFRAVVLAEGERLAVQDFPQIAAQVPGYRPEIPAPPAFAARPVYQGPAMIDSGTLVPRSITLSPVQDSPLPGIPALTEDGEIRRLDDIEADLIKIALGHYRGHITEVARRLGIGRSTLYRKMREFGLASRHN